jgi:uncharacterized protein YhfF
MEDVSEVDSDVEGGFDSEGDVNGVVDGENKAECVGETEEVRVG